MKRETYIIHNAWKKYKAWQKANPGKIREGQEIRSLYEFKGIYQNPDIGHRIRKIKQQVMYSTDYNTFMAYKKTYKELKGETLEYSARKLSTRQLAERLRPEIEEYRKNLAAQGKSNKEIALAVSHHFFGS